MLSVNGWMWLVKVGQISKSTTLHTFIYILTSNLHLKHGSSNKSVGAVTLLVGSCETHPSALRPVVNDG